MSSATGEQAHPEHAEAGAALRDLRLPFPEDREGADLQAWFWQGLRLSQRMSEPEFSDAVQCSAHCPFASEGQQAAHPSELQRHHL